MVKNNKGKAALEKWEPGMLVLANGYAVILIKSNQFKEKPAWECEYLGYPEKTVYSCFTTNLMALHVNDEVADIQKEEPSHKRGIAKAKEMIEAGGNGPWSCTPGRNPTPTLLKKNGVRRNVQQNGVNGNGIVPNGNGIVSDSDTDDDEELARRNSFDKNVNDDNQRSQVADNVRDVVSLTTEKNVSQNEAGSGCSKNGGNGGKKEEINQQSRHIADVGRGDSPTKKTNVLQSGDIVAGEDASKNEEKGNYKADNDSARHHGIDSTAETKGRQVKKTGDALGDSTKGKEKRMKKNDSEIRHVANHIRNGVGSTSKKNGCQNEEIVAEGDGSKIGEKVKNMEEIEEVSRHVVDHFGPADPIAEVNRQDEKTGDECGFNRNGGDEKKTEEDSGEESHAAPQINNLGNEVIEPANRASGINERRRRHSGVEVEEPEVQRRRIEPQGIWERIIAPLTRLWPF